MQKTYRGPRSLSENSVVGPRASVFSPDKDGEAGDVCFIVDTRGQSGGKQAAQSQIEFSDRLLGAYLSRTPFFSLNLCPSSGLRAGSCFLWPRCLWLPATLAGTFYPGQSGRWPSGPAGGNPFRLCCPPRQIRCVLDL